MYTCPEAPPFRLVAFIAAGSGRLQREAMRISLQLLLLPQGKDPAAAWSISRMLSVISAAKWAGSCVGTVLAVKACLFCLLGCVQGSACWLGRCSYTKPIFYSQSAGQVADEKGDIDRNALVFKYHVTRDT